MLNKQEQADLYAVYVVTLGDEPAVRSAQSRFNEETLVVIETAVSEAASCNGRMQALVLGLLGGGSILAKGWLRRILGRFRKALNETNVTFKGYGCRATVVSRYRTAILETTLL